jgi:flagellar biosynthetic protein FliP
MRFNTRALVLILSAIGLMALAGHAAAQSAASFNVSVGSNGVGNGKDQDIVPTLQILALLTVLSLAPAILMLTTAFTRIVIILSFLRQALGTPTIPPNQVVIGLSLFLTFFVMGPTYNKVNDVAIQPLMRHEIKSDVAIQRASKPMKDFMLKNTYEKDLTLLMGIRHETAKSANDVSITTVIPAFILSELKTAFIIGFYIFIPFLIIDLIVASTLMSMGMMMMPPTVVSLPAKILVFVLANGWATLIAAIMAGYHT